MKISFTYLKFDCKNSPLKINRLNSVYNIALNIQKVREHRSERNEITSSQLTNTGKFNKD